MRQVARKGLITIAAAGGVLAAVGGYAHADSGASGGTAHSPGVASGNNVQAPVDVEVNACGNSINVVGLLNPTFGNKCSNDGGGKHRGPSGGDHRDHHGNGGKHRSGSGGHQGSGASGSAVDSPGVASGNNVQAPVHVPVNVCGNSVDVVGLVNPTSGNGCDNDSSMVPPTSPDSPEHHGGHHPPTGQQPGDRPGSPERPSDSGQPSAPEDRNGPGVSDSTDTPDTTGMRPQTESEPRSEIVTTPGAAKAKPQGGGQLAHTGSGAMDYAAPSAALLLGGAVLYRRARSARR
ncbi:DUF320 domain-containing protein [Streptomyces piniterrae]|uniref:DUF320 domain-containing protein n=1 Tax=Streptomyces piniterrae TaxID=2571125 RepID=A0A4V5MI06_9ACTN|nr:chaplin [Streptomyces piniterrae]TJZ43528.1 DUF320 domain-containing protein [Streptomyces piniterrae]